MSEVTQEEILMNKWLLSDVKDFVLNYTHGVTTAAVIAAYHRGDLDIVIIGRHLLIVLSAKTLDFKFQKRKKRV